MAIVYTYPIGTPAAGDLLVGTKTPVEGEAFEPKTTLNFTVQSILDLVPFDATGTVGTIPVFTGTNTVGNSIITQSNSSIGIGTTTPSSKLEVNGTIAAHGDGYKINGMGWAREASDVLTLGDWNGNEFSTRIMDQYSDEVLRVANGGVGIGLTNPSAKLQVYRDDATIAASLAEATSRASVKIRSSSTDGAHLAISQGEFGCTQLQVSSTNGTTPRNIRIQPFGGNVSIGTSTSSQRLHVDGAVRVTGGYYDSSNSQGTSGKVLSSTGSGTSWVDTLSGTGLADRVVRWTGSNTITSSSIRDNGTNVGIGQSAAGDEILTVGSGTGSGNGGLFIKDPFAGGSRFVSSKNPMLSLGTAAVTGATSTIFMGSASTTTAQDGKIEYNRGNGSDTRLGIFFKGQGTYREHLRFGDVANSTPRSVFFGKVGIDTTSPTAQLDVNGTIVARTSIKLFSGSNELLQMFPSGGTNVYINTSTSGGTINFGAPAANTTNIDVQGKATAEELESTTSSKGLILKSPDGTRYRVTVANGGTLSVSAV